MTHTIEIQTKQGDTLTLFTDKIIYARKSKLGNAEVFISGAKEGLMLEVRMTYDDFIKLLR